MGNQIAARRMDEAAALRVAQGYEVATSWHLRRSAAMTQVTEGGTRGNRRWGWRAGGMA